MKLMGLASFGVCAIIGHPTAASSGHKTAVTLLGSDPDFDLEAGFPGENQQGVQ